MLRLTSVLLFFVFMSPQVAAAQDSKTEPADHFDSFDQKPKKGKESKSQAKQYFEKAVNAFASENYGEALMYFKESYKINPKLKVLLNIGMCQRAMYDFKAAIETFNEYLKKGGKKVPKKKRNELKDLIIEMESSLPQLTITINEIDALILVNGDEVGFSPLQSILTLNPGDHVIEAQKDGFTGAEETITLKEGDHEVVSLTLVPLILDEAISEEPVDESKKAKKKKILMHSLIWGIVGAVVIGAGTTTGVVLHQKSGKAPGPAADWTIDGR